MALDPVCGMTVDPEKAAGHVEHEGTTHFFCSKHCAHAFKADPKRFLKKEPPKKAQPQGARYTCPMHPEIVQIGPGSCPKCGMALEPMDIVATEGPDPEYAAMRLRLWVSAVLSAPLLFISMFGNLVGLHFTPSI